MSPKDYSRLGGWLKRREWGMFDALWGGQLFLGGCCATVWRFTVSIWLHHPCVAGLLQWRSPSIHVGPFVSSVLWFCVIWSVFCESEFFVDLVWWEALWIHDSSLVVTCADWGFVLLGSVLFLLHFRGAGTVSVSCWGCVLSVLSFYVTGALPPAGLLFSWI